MSYFERLEADLTAAAARHNNELASTGDSRRAEFTPLATPGFGWRRTALTAAAVVAVTLVAGLTVSAARAPEAEASSVSVTTVDGIVRISVMHRGAPPATVVEDLEAAGLDAELFDAPTGPSKVGRLLGLVIHGTDTAAVDAYEVQVPQDWEGRVRVLSGASAIEDEMYVTPTDAFGAGEPLACLEPGTKVKLVREQARRVGVELVWTDPSGRELALPPAPTAAVESATAVSAEQVVVRVDDGQEGTSARCR